MLMIPYGVLSIWDGPGTELRNSPAGGSAAGIALWRGHCGKDTARTSLWGWNGTALVKDCATGTALRGWHCGDCDVWALPWCLRSSVAPQERRCEDAAVGTPLQCQKRTEKVSDWLIHSSVQWAASGAWAPREKGPGPRGASNDQSARPTIPRTTLMGLIPAVLDNGHVPMWHSVWALESAGLDVPHCEIGCEGSEVQNTSKNQHSKWICIVRSTVVEEDTNLSRWSILLRQKSGKNQWVPKDAKRAVRPHCVWRSDERFLTNWPFDWVSPSHTGWIRDLVRERLKRPWAHSGRTDPIATSKHFTKLKWRNNAVTDL